MIYYLVTGLCLILSKLLFRVKAYGTGNIPKKGGFVLASNHVSFLDPVILGVCCPRRLNFMARHDLFLHPVFSWLLPRLGAFPVKRDSADASALKEAIRRLRSGKVLVVFPEGRRAEEGKGPDPKSGIGFLVAKSNVPVIPAFVKGTDRAWPRQAKFIRPEKVQVTFGERVFLDKAMPYQEIAQHIMDSIRHLE